MAAGPAYAHPDFLMSASGAAVTQEAPVNAVVNLPLEGISLVEISEGARFFALDRCESYLHAAQDFAKKYDWDGKLIVDRASPLQPGWRVPMADRRPCVRYDVARVIVDRFTALLFGTDRFPELSVQDDPEAEEFIRWLADESRIQQRFVQARSLGGAVGSVAMSFSFVNGKPRAEVHNAKHCRVLEWTDRGDFRPKRMLKAYKYPKQVFDPKAKKLVVVDYYYARYWDDSVEVVWDPIPVADAILPDWKNRVKSRSVVHNFGFCPAYWVQNRPCDEDEDGFSDFHGLFENFDEINRLMSAATRAVKANSDPTLVVKTSPAHNEGHIKKGQDAAIFAEGGADYLIVPPGAVDAIFKTMNEIVKGTLDVAAVVLVNPDDITGQLSSLTLRMLFAPMLAQADVYREQYGEMGLKRILRDMLRASRHIGLAPPVFEVSPDGTKLIESRAGLLVPPRIERAEDGTITRHPRTPGESDAISLNWNPYFSPTWTDIKAATEAAQLANGGKPLISQKTSIASVQTLYGVSDVDAELLQIHEDAERAVEQAQRAMMGNGPTPAALDRAEGNEETEAPKGAGEPTAGPEGEPEVEEA